MPSLVPKLIPIHAKAFDTKRRLLNQFTTLRLLKTDGTIKNYKSIQTLSSGWFYEWFNYYSVGVLFIANATEGFYETLENTTHFALDEMVYKIQKEKTNTLKVEPPNGTQPYFKIPIIRTSETFTP